MSAKSARYVRSLAIRRFKATAFDWLVCRGYLVIDTFRGTFDEAQDFAFNAYGDGVDVIRSR